MNINDAVTGGPFARQDATVDVISVEPDPDEPHNKRQFSPFPFDREDGFQSGYNPGDVNLSSILEKLHVFSSKQQVLDVAVIHIQLESLNNFLLLSIDVINVFIRDELGQNTLAQG